MKRARRRFPRLGILGTTLAAVVLVALSSNAAWSQSRTIRLVDPDPPGGLADLLARILAEEISRAQGVTIVVENRAGAASAIGTEAVARAAPDGTTLLLNATPFVINPLLRKLNYDPLRSFAPICYLVNSPTVIAVNAASPYRTLADLINAAREKPGELTLASIGPGTATHIAFEMLRSAANIDMTFVPYPGTAPAVTALLGGHVTSYFGIYSVVSEQVKAGSLRALATAAPARIDLLPDVPTVAEAGVPEYQYYVWFGLWAPKNTPQPIVDKLHAAVVKALADPTLQQRLAAVAGEPFDMPLADITPFVKTEIAKWADVVKRGGVKVEQ